MYQCIVGGVELNKTDELERLFLSWEQKQENEPDYVWKKTKGGENFTKSHFRRDGIIDEETFEKETTKVLFVSYEANDDDYSAKNNPKPNTVDDYYNYYLTKHEDYRGKMKERLSEYYKVIVGLAPREIENYDAVRHFAIMDLNKRGGGPKVKDKHVLYYCLYYKEFIKKEIEIISPDVIAFLGAKDKDEILRVLGATCIGDKVYYKAGEKTVPVLTVWNTAFRYGKRFVKPLEEYNNDIVGSLCAKCKMEAEKYGLINN